MGHSYPDAKSAVPRAGRVSLGIATLIACGGSVMQILALHEFQQTGVELEPGSRKPSFLDMDLFGYGVAVLLAGGLALNAFLSRTDLHRANGRILVTIAILQSIFILTLVVLLFGIDRRAAETPSATESPTLRRDAGSREQTA